MEDKIKCLYYIKDIRTDKIIYIGQTENYKRRKYHHFGQKERPVDKYIYEQGRENFTMERFDIDCSNMSDNERKQKEDELIITYDTINNGFNKNRSGMISNNIEYYKEYLKNYYKNTEYYKEYLKKYQKTEHYKEYKKQYQKDYYQKHKEKYRLKKKQEKTASPEG